MKVDKTLVASVVLHVLVIGWGVISFSSRAFESAEQSVPIEFVTDDQFSKMTAGTKSGQKENPKPLVEKVADAKPVDDNIGKITEKEPIVTDAGPDPTPVEKPVEKKPDPPKPVAEIKPKVDPKPIEKKPDPPKIDPIAEALKKDEAKKRKPAPKPQAKAAPPAPAKKHEYKFDAEAIAADLDKRNPTRQAYAGAELNSIGAAWSLAWCRAAVVAVRNGRHHGASCSAMAGAVGCRESGGTPRYGAFPADQGAPSRGSPSGGLNHHLSAQSGRSGCCSSRRPASAAVHNAARRDL